MWNETSWPTGGLIKLYHWRTHCYLENFITIIMQNKIICISIFTLSLKSCLHLDHHCSPVTMKWEWSGPTKIHHRRLTCCQQKHLIVWFYQFHWKMSKNCLNTMIYLKKYIRKVNFTQHQNHVLFDNFVLANDKWYSTI